MLSIIRNEARSFYRDALSIIFSIVFPCTLVFLLGTFLESVENSDDTVGSISISYNVSESAFGSGVEKYIDALEEKGVLVAQKADNKDAFSEGIKSGDICAAIYENNGKITVYVGNSEVKNRTVSALFAGYAVNTDAYIAAANYNPQSLSKINIPNGDFVEFDGLKKTSLIDHYAVSMLIMILFMGSTILSATSYYNERKIKTINRINISPINAGKVYIGKVIGSLFSSIIQCASVMLSSVFLFGAHYCPNVEGNLLFIAMIISVIVGVNALGVFIGMFFKKISPTPILIGILWVMMFFSGIFTSEIYIKGFSEYMPAYQVQQAAFDLTMFNRSNRAVAVIVVSGAFLIAFSLLGALKVKFRRRAA